MPFELIHTHIRVLASIVSKGDFRYYIHFDDYSRYTWIYLMIVKSKAVSIFKHFHLMVGQMFNAKIKCLQSYWNGKYRSFLPYLQSYGIQYRHSCPHMHQ